MPMLTLNGATFPVAADSASLTLVQTGELAQGSRMANGTGIQDAIAARRMWSIKTPPMAPPLAAPLLALCNGPTVVTAAGDMIGPGAVVCGADATKADVQAPLWSGNVFQNNAVVIELSLMEL